MGLCEWQPQGFKFSLFLCEVLYSVFLGFWLNPNRDSGKGKNGEKKTSLEYTFELGNSMLHCSRHTQKMVRGEVDGGRIEDKCIGASSFAREETWRGFLTFPELHSRGLVQPAGKGKGLFLTIARSCLYPHDLPLIQLVWGQCAYQLSQH